LSSVRFAKLCATVFLSQDYKVYFLGQLNNENHTAFVPTPFVPFGVMEYNCIAGIMITASHNPREDNGFKLYGSNGSQIIPPHDSNISSSILSNLTPWMNYDVNILDSHPNLINITEELSLKYLNRIYELCQYKEQNLSSNFPVVYTGMSLDC
jgi:phosphomannomutase